MRLPPLYLFLLDILLDLLTFWFWCYSRAFLWAHSVFAPTIRFILLKKIACFQIFSSFCFCDNNLLMIMCTALLHTWMLHYIVNILGSQTSSNYAKNEHILSFNSQCFLCSIWFLLEIILIKKYITLQYLHICTKIQVLTQQQQKPA